MILHLNTADRTLIETLRLCADLNADAVLADTLGQGFQPGLREAGEARGFWLQRGAGEAIEMDALDIGVSLGE